MGTTIRRTLRYNGLSNNECRANTIYRKRTTTIHPVSIQSSPYNNCRFDESARTKHLTLFVLYPGYYADLDARCQVFRVCANTDLTGQGFAFLCPNGTLFNQRFFVCDWYNNVDCSSSEQFYNRNGNEGVGGHEEMMANVKQMLQFPLTQPFLANDQTVTPPSSLSPQSTVSSTFPQYPVTVPLPTISTTKGVLPTGQPTGVTQIPGQPFNILPNGVGLVEPSATYPGNIVRPQFPTSSSEDTEDGNSEAVTHDGHKDQTVYVSSLGELSTDVNSGFDINKSKFLVVDTETTTTERPKLAIAYKHLEELLEAQVALLGQSINNNGLTQQTQITRTGSNRFLPRLIASNVIVPLPKGFQKSRQQVVGDANRPLTYTATESPPRTGQYPTEQFSFPAVPLTPPSSPVPFTVAPTEPPSPPLLRFAFPSQQQTESRITVATAGTRPLNLTSNASDGKERVSLLSSFQVGALNWDSSENVNEKQIFTYPSSQKVVSKHGTGIVQCGPGGVLVFK